MGGLDDDLAGHAAAQSDGGVRGAVADKERAPEDGPAVELDEIVPVKAEGQKPAADGLAAAEIDDPQGFAGRRIKQGHSFSDGPVYPR